MNAYDWSHVDDEPWRIPATTEKVSYFGQFTDEDYVDLRLVPERLWLARGLVAFWAVLAALVFTLTLRRLLR